MTSARAELLCDRARQLTFKFEGETLKAVTLSIGVAIFPENGFTSEALLKVADAALYRAKDEGRNRVIVADDTTFLPGEPNQENEKRKQRFMNYAA